ncbi:MAG: hypothetical protein JRG83_22645 [Deltaproteobacteria bacterium]|nr:hypothetical protein [Deltaproteobacteria bacterium]
MREFGENFRPALGFVNRTDAREYRADLRFRERPERWLRTVDTGFDFLVITDLDSAIESADLRLDWLDVRTESNDQVRFRSHLRRERLDAPFEISKRVILPIGRHDFLRHEVLLSSSDTRRIRGEVRVQWGTFYTGDRLTFDALLELRPTRHFFIALEAEQNRVRLPEGNFDLRLARIRFDAMANPSLSWTTTFQYDNASESLGINSRIRWIVAPERELIFVVNQGFQHGDGRRLHSTVSELVAKIQWSFRY